MNTTKAAGTGAKTRSDVEMELQQSMYLTQ